MRLIGWIKDKIEQARLKEQERLKAQIFKDPNEAIAYMAFVIDRAIDDLSLCRPTFTSHIIAQLENASACCTPEFMHTLRTRIRYIIADLEQERYLLETDDLAARSILDHTIYTLHHACFRCCRYI